MYDWASIAKWRLRHNAENNICLERNRLQNNLCIITFNITQYDCFTFTVDVLLSNTSTNTRTTAATTNPIATITTTTPESPYFHIII